MFKIDVDGFAKQLEKKKRDLIAGFEEAKRDLEPFLVNRMKVKIEECVYSVYNPRMYKRTDKLLNSVRTHIEGDTVYVYVDTTGMELTQDGVPYAYRVKEGHEVHPYEHLSLRFEWLAYMDSRDWVEPTYNDLLDAARTGNSELLQIIIKAVQKHLGR